MDKPISKAGLQELLSSAAGCIATPSDSQATIIRKLRFLSERLTTERFQLAVLGQFKRGKSTVLNALLGQPVLPTGVVPVTAIATFLEPATSRRIRVTYGSGKVEEFEAKDSGGLRERLTAFVTEEANPRNKLGVARVDVLLPAELLERGVVLIDTPGVGSTLSHNTAAADAVLPECDAALFVVSADPPITEIELEYLARIRKTVARLIVVLNKIDNVELYEREKAATFLRRVLVDNAHADPFTPIFTISARAGLQANESGDKSAFEASGLKELEDHLTQFLASDKRETLNTAIARKADALVADLQLEIQIELKALRRPLEDLQQRIGTFDTALQRFEAERRTAGDQLAGDRLRALQELEALAEKLRTDARATLEREMEEALSKSQDADAARSRLTAATIDFFENALRDVIQDVGARIESMFVIHQRRADELISLVRQTAANLLEIPFRAPESSEAFEAKRDPFWVTASRTVELSAIPPGAFDRLLPAAMCRARLRKRLLEEIDNVVVRNVENLRWATRQNLADTFRRFGAELDERLKLSLAATRGAMEKALERRRQHSEQADSEIETKQAAAARLGQISDALARIQ